jgi:hypothetical protein
MPYSKRSINDMYNRALDCVDTVLTDLPANSEGAAAAAGLRAQYDIIIAESAAQSGFGGTAQQGSAQRAVARQNIRNYLSTLARTAASIARRNPGFDRNYPSPSGKNDNALLADARAVAQKALTDKQAFIGRGLTVEYLEAGTNFIEAFDTSLDTSYQALAQRGAATGSKDNAYDLADEFFDVLDDFVRNYYRSQPQKLAAWKIASHIERSPRRNSSETPPTA